MGKTAPLKKKGPVSVRSRAARRAVSPSLNLDKTLKGAKPPTESSDRQHVASGGISKAKVKAKQMSAKRRKRLERSMDMAERVGDRTGQKVEKSVGKGKKGKERKIIWEDLNKKIKADKGNRFRTLVEQENMEGPSMEQSNWEDVELVETEQAVGMVAINDESEA